MKDQLLIEMQKEANRFIEEWYKDGAHLVSNELKNYTSGDKKKVEHGSHLGLEGIVNKIVDLVVEKTGTQDHVVCNSDYFKATEVGYDDDAWEKANATSDKEWDPQRLDHHIWFDDKVILALESRAWIDKPFYTLKRAVVRNMMKLPYCTKHFDEDVEFYCVALCCDILDRHPRTLDYTLGFGDIVDHVALSPFRRGYQKKNYFYFGHNTTSVDLLVEKIYTKIVAAKTKFLESHNKAA